MLYKLRRFEPYKQIKNSRRYKYFYTDDDTGYERNEQFYVYFNELGYDVLKLNNAI